MARAALVTTQIPYFRRSKGGEAASEHAWPQFLQDSRDCQLQQEWSQSDTD